MADSDTEPALCKGLPQKKAAHIAMAKKQREGWRLRGKSLPLPGCTSRNGPLATVLYLLVAN